MPELESTSYGDLMEIQQSKDVCIEKLTSTEGHDLEITANITSSGQMAAIVEGHVAHQLNSRYGINKMERLLRISCSWQARARDDLTGIGKTADVVPGWQARNDEQ